MSNVVDLNQRRGAPAVLPMPHSIENEQAFLGALLINNDVLLGAASKLEPEHFVEEAHRRIFDVSRSLIRSGRSATPVTLRPFLGEHDLAEGVSLANYLAHLAANGAAPITAGSHAQVLMDLHSRRRLVAIADEARAVALDPPAAMSVDALIDKAEGDLASIRADTPVQVVTRGTAGEMSGRLLDRVRRIRNGVEVASGVSTGLPDIDRDTGGLAPGQLWIIAGRPAIGKTIFATKLTRTAGHNGVGAMLFSLEVSEEQINARLLADVAYSSYGGIPFRRILAGDVDDRELSRLDDAQQHLDAAPIVIDCPSGVTVAQIATKVRAERVRMAAQGVALGVVVIDYLDFISAGDRYRGNRVYEVAEISRGLKQLAKDQGLCVVLLAQLNRQVEQRPDKRPVMSDLRDSGNLEQDADVVAMIYREAYYLERTAEFVRGDPDALSRFEDVRHDLDLIIGKNRAGPTRSHRMWCDVACSVVSAKAKGGA